MAQYRIAILSNFTYDTIVPYLKKVLFSMDSRAEFYLCPFNQYAQEILNPESGLYKFNPDVVILALEGERLFADLIEYPYDLENTDKEAIIEDILSQIDSFFQLLTDRLSAMVLFHNFIIPSITPFSVLDTKYVLGVKEIYYKLNTGLCEISRRYRSVFVFDIESIGAEFGKKNLREEKLRYLAAMDLTDDFLEVVSKEYLRYLRPLRGIRKKCLVLDLDNVLWGGIIGEDGLSGIRLGHQAPGNAYLSFQKAVLGLYKRGIILAVNSKNNFDDAIEAFRKHPEMVLKEEYFASIKINWNDKASNMKEISEEIGIDLDSFVFIDDSPIERKIVRDLLPQVEVPEMPDDAALFKNTLMSLQSFESISITEEDKKRGSLYLQEKKRRKHKASFQNLDDFLMSLETKCYVRNVDEISLSRVCQLIQRTNQFNLTSRRYTETQLQSFLDKDNILFLSLSVKDVFGNNGIVGVAIIIKGQNEAGDIDTFLISCRVLGRSIEQAFLTEAINRLKSKGVKRLSATFIPTKKNFPSKDFLKNAGFENIPAPGPNMYRWILDCEKACKIPKWIEVDNE